LIKRLLLPNLSIITNDYDSVGRQLGTWLKTSTSTLLDSATYGYNTANQRTNFANATGTNYLYRYDNIGQLTNADSSVNSEDRSYVYDAAWNLSSRKVAGVSSTFTVDSKNQYVRAPYPLVTHYDTNGNLIDSQSFKRTYAYDDENRLIEFASYAVSSSSPSVGDKLTDFVYDGLGRMRRRLEYHYVGQGQSPLQTPSS